MRAILPALLAAVFALPIAAQEPAKPADDPIAEKLTKVKEAYVQELGKAKEAVLKACDKRYEEIKSLKSLKLETQLKQLEAVEAEKKAFEENDTLPTSLNLKPAVSDYRTAVKKAEGALKAGFDDAAKAYRDKGDVKAASATLAEYKEFVAAPAAGGPPKTFVIAVSTGMVIAPDGGTEGSKVRTAEYSKKDEGQLWKAVPTADGYCLIEHVKTGLLLSVSNKGKGNGSEIVLAKKDAKSTDSQEWKTAPVQGKNLVKFVNKNSGKVFGVDNRSTKSGERILQWDDENHQAEWFTVIAPK